MNAYGEQEQEEDHAGDAEDNNVETKQEEPMEIGNDNNVVVPGQYLKIWKSNVIEMVERLNWKYRDFKAEQGNQFIFDSTVNDTTLQIWAKNDGYRFHITFVMKKSIEKLTWNKLKEKLADLSPKN